MKSSKKRGFVLSACIGTALLGGYLVAPGVQAASLKGAPASQSEEEQKVNQPALAEDMYAGLTKMELAQAAQSSRKPVYQSTPAIPVSASKEAAFAVAPEKNEPASAATAASSSALTGTGVYVAQDTKNGGTAGVYNSLTKDGLWVGGTADMGTGFHVDNTGNAAVNGIVIGTQEATYKTGNKKETGNYISGLDNTSWDGTNYVSGRAATEDQLKEVAKSVGSGADYHLISKTDTTGKDVAYTADDKGNVDLTVQNGTDAKDQKKVTIADVASKKQQDTNTGNITTNKNSIETNKQSIIKNAGDISNNTTNINKNATDIGKVDKFAVKYDAKADDAKAPNKNSITLGGTDYATDTSGKHTGGTSITNVAYADGNTGSAAANVDYVKDRVQTVADAERHVTGGSVNAGNGTIDLTMNQGNSVTVSGLDTYVKSVDSYVTDAKLEGNTLKITQNNQRKEFTIDLGALGGSSTDYHLISKTDTTGKDVAYTADDKGNVDLTVQNGTDAKDQKKVTIADVASKKQQDTNTGNITTNQTNIETNKQNIATNTGDITTINGKLDGAVMYDKASPGTGYDKTSITLGYKDGETQHYTKIQNVANGTADNDAVNKSQLDKVETEAGKHSTVSASGNLTMKKTDATDSAGANYDIKLNDTVTLGTGDNVVTLDGKAGTIIAGEGDSQISLNGGSGNAVIGKVTVKGTAGTITGLTNTTWNGTAVTGQAATEDQLQTVAGAENYVTGGSLDTSAGTITLDRQIGADVTITGLDAYVLWDTGDGVEAKSYINQVKLKDGVVTADDFVMNFIPEGGASKEQRSFKTAGIVPGTVEGNKTVGSIVLGDDAKVISGKVDSSYNIVIGNKTKVQGSTSDSTDTKENADYNIAIGSNSDILATGDVTARQNTVLGSNAHVKNISDAVVVGYGANILLNGIGATATGSMAIGSGAKVETINANDNATGSIALGQSSSVTAAQGSVALGANSIVVAGENNVISVGGVAVGTEGDEGYKAAFQRRIINVAPGKETYDAVNYGQFTGKTTTGGVSTNFLNAVSKIDWEKVAQKSEAIDAKLNEMADNAAAAEAPKAANFSLRSRVSPTMLAEEETKDSKPTPGTNPDGSAAPGNGFVTDTSGKNTVTGDTTFKNAVTVEGQTTLKGGLDMADNKITNVKDGEVSEKSKDAVNGSQLHTEQQARIEGDKILGDQINQFGRSINQLGGEIDSVGAISAALAGLHPIDYDPTESKYQLAAAMGSYDGSTAMALGGFYNVNKNVLLSFGVSSALKGQRKTAGNIGATFRIGAGNDKASPEDYTNRNLLNELAAVKRENTAQKEHIAAQDQKLAAVEQENTSQKEALEDQRKRLDQLEAALMALQKNTH